MHSTETDSKGSVFYILEKFQIIRSLDVHLITQK